MSGNPEKKVISDPGTAPTLVPISSGQDSDTSVPETPFPQTPRTPIPLPKSNDAATILPVSTYLSLSLSPGVVLSGRYEIVDVIGQGGMGAVYKAQDRELERVVALKLIRPELACDASILERFKQEVTLASKVTHRNAVRIYDLGESDGWKFLTMEYVEGADLAKILREHGPFSPEEASAYILQVCNALQAAHAEGVVHRDLKPQNIMCDSHGRIVVMDFGLARSLETSGMTQTGALLGTMEYMSPEQAMGEVAGPPSDLFAVGLIFYELLTAKMPYSADSAVASLLKRTRERALPVSTVKATVPRTLSNIVARCLETKASDRYQTTTELIKDLERWQGNNKQWTWRDHVPRIRVFRKRQVAFASVGLGLVLLMGGVAASTFFRNAAPQKMAVAKEPSISLAILPFRNLSNDASLDWMGASIAEMLTTDVGQSADLRMVSPDRLNQVLRDLKTDAMTASPDATTLRRVADFANADTLISGQYVRSGDKIRVDAIIHDLKSNRRVAVKAEAANEQQLIAMVDELARRVRENLSLDNKAKETLTAQSFKPSSQNLEALRAYSEGLQATRRGNHLEAKKSFEAATQADPKFALAFARLGQNQVALGYDDAAESFARKAVGLSEGLPIIERNMIAAVYASVTNDHEKAEAAYKQLLQAWPDNVDLLFELAGNYEEDGKYKEALETYGRIVKLDPKHVDALLATGRVYIKSEHPQDGLEWLNRAYTLAVQLQNDEEMASILQAQGVAFKLLTRPQDALRNYEQSLAIKRRIGQQRGIAVSLNEIAQVQEQMGNNRQALAAFEEALKIRRDIGDKSGTADTLLDLSSFYNEQGQSEKALSMLKQSLQLEREIGSALGEALCLNNIGSIYFAQDQYDDANTYFERAFAIYEKAGVQAEMVESLHNLAETDALVGRMDQALAHYMKALDIRRSMGDERGAGIEYFSIGSLFALQARYDAALQSQEDALKIFRAAGDKTVWMVQILNGYGAALAQAGRFDDAGKALNESLALSRSLNNPAYIAQAMTYAGDNDYYRGKFAEARALYERALQEAEKSKDRSVALTAQVRLARVDSAQHSPKLTAQSAGQLVEQADRLGLKYLALEASLVQAQVLLRSGATQRALDVASRVDAASARSGYRMLNVFAHGIEAQAAPKHAAEHYSTARSLLAEIRKDAKDDAILHRSDLVALNEAAASSDVAKK